MDITTFLVFLPFLDALGPDAAKAIGAGLAMGLGGLGPALAIGMLVGKAMEALGGNPEARAAIQTDMILGVAFAEAIGLYALLSARILAFVSESRRPPAEVPYGSGSRGTRSQSSPADRSGGQLLRPAVRAQARGLQANPEDAR
jgi:F-type H+-transporting ATPase subunit c